MFTTKRLLIILSLIAVIVVGAAVVLAIRLQQQRTGEVIVLNLFSNLSFNKKSSSINNNSGSLPERSPVFSSETTEIESVLSEIDRPFLVENPCFLQGFDFCVQAIRTDESSESFRVESTLTSLADNGAKTFITGRMLTYQGGLFNFYQESNILQEDFRPFYFTINEIHRMAAKHSLNPAFLYTILDRIYISGQEQEMYLGNNSLETAFDLDTFGRLVSSGLDNTQSGRFSDSIAQLEAGGFSHSNAVVAAALLEMVNPDLVQSILAGGGVLEEHYHQIFSPTFPDQSFQVSAEESIVATTYYSGESPQDLALCKNNQSYLCRFTESGAECLQADFLAFFCTD